MQGRKRRRNSSVQPEGQGKCRKRPNGYTSTRSATMDACKRFASRIPVVVQFMQFCLLLQDRIARALSMSLHLVRRIVLRGVPIDLLAFAFDCCMLRINLRYLQVFHKVNKCKKGLSQRGLASHSFHQLNCHACSRKNQTLLKELERILQSSSFGCLPRLPGALVPSSN